MERFVVRSLSAGGSEGGRSAEDGTCKTLTNRNIAFNSRDFVKSAWADIERFKEQKNHDLKEALISYAVMQISVCKKVRLREARLVYVAYQQGIRCRLAVSRNIAVTEGWKSLA